MSKPSEGPEQRESFPPDQAPPHPTLRRHALAAGTSAETMFTVHGPARRPGRARWPPRWPPAALRVQVENGANNHFERPSRVVRHRKMKRFPVTNCRPPAGEGQQGQLLRA